MCRTCVGPEQVEQLCHSIEPLPVSFRGVLTLRHLLSFYERPESDGPGPVNSFSAFSMNSSKLLESKTSAI